MKNYGLVVILILFNVIARTAYADWSVDFVRITCIPEARYFQFDYTPVSGSAVLLETQFDDKMREKRLFAWQQHGYYDPAHLQYECHLPESAYTISANQPPARERGMCGAAPQITLSLLRNGVPILDKVIFGNDCFGGPTVTSMEITDGLQGWDTRQMTLCFDPNSDLPKTCKFLSETYSDITKAIPINQEKVDEYAKKTR